MILAACSLCGYAQSSTADISSPSDSSQQQDVGVEGTHLTMNGQPWQSRGVALQGFVRPLALLSLSLRLTKTIRKQLSFSTRAGVTAGLNWSLLTHSTRTPSVFKSVNPRSTPILRCTTRII
jgi:hypothetical protein